MRTGGKALLAGSISRLGSQYMVGLEAVNCGTGDTLAKEQEEASSTEQVVKVLGGVASSLRTKLGESLVSVQKLAHNGTAAAAEFQKSLTTVAS